MNLGKWFPLSGALVFSSTKGGRHGGPRRSLPDLEFCKKNGTSYPMKLSGETRGRGGDVCCRLGWRRWGFLCCLLQLQRTGMTAAVTHKGGGDAGRGPPQLSRARAGEQPRRWARPAPGLSGRASRRSEKPQGPGTGRRSGKSSALTRSPGWDTPSPHSPHTWRRRERGRSSCTSGKAKPRESWKMAACALSTRPLEYLVWEPSRSPRPLATVVKGTMGVSRAATRRTSETEGERAPSGGEREGILDWATF